MKRLLLFTCILLFILCGCKNKNKNNQIMSAVSAQTDTITNPVSSLLTDTVLPQFIDLKQDISHLSFQELRLLRSYPYAIHGYHFMEADINAFFSANTKWYNNLVNDIYWDAEEGKGKFAESYEEVKKIASEIKGPVLFNNVEGGRSPFLSRQELEEAGVKMTIYPNAQTRVVAKKCMELLNTLQQTGTTAGMENEMLSHRELWSMFNSEKWVAIEKKYMPD